MNHNTAREKAVSRKSSSKSPKPHKNYDGVHPGSRGVLLTCEKDFEKRASRELLEALSRYVDDTPTAEIVEGRLVDISKAIKSEVALLKKGTSSRLHIKYMSGVQGSGFVLFEPSAPDPSEVVTEMISDVYGRGDIMFKTCIKIIPFTQSCKATMEDMESLAAKLIPLEFPEGDGDPVFEFAVHVEKHCAHNLKVHSKEIIKIFADCVNPRHSVNLTHPKKVILVSVIKNLCCVSIVDGCVYEKYGKFNVRQCFEKYLETNEDENKTVDSEIDLRRGIEAN